MFDSNGKHSRSNSTYASFNNSYMCESDKEISKSAKNAKDFFDWIDVVTVALVTVIIVFTFFVRVATISGQSMENTFHDGEKVVVSGFNYKPKQGDVVIVSRNYYNNPNIDPVDSNSQPIIKRVIATENQTIMIKDGNVYVDGEMLDEPYINNYHLGATTDAGHSSLDLENGVTVPKGCVFVMGDNRDNSRDSRFDEIGNRGNGLIDNEFIIGKVYYRIFPFNVFGGVY